MSTAATTSWGSEGDRSNWCGMKTAALWFSLILFLLVLVGALRTVFERRVPFVKVFDDSTRQAYIVLLIAAAGLFAWARLDLHIESVEIAGVKASVGQLSEKVKTLSDQMEVFFKSKHIEIFDRHNWNRVHLVSKTAHGVILSVTLDQEPIPGSVEVFEGVLLMPEQEYLIDGRKIQFPANTDTPVDGLTVKYYPRVSGP
jgi:hypothetical protein